MQMQIQGQIMGVKRFSGQPPSGGCELKLGQRGHKQRSGQPAAFGRL